MNSHTSFRAIYLTTEVTSVLALTHKNSTKQKIPLASPIFLIYNIRRINLESLKFFYNYQLGGINYICQLLKLRKKQA